MILRFPELQGGQVQGLNDAGVENFQGAVDEYLARECGQNSGDASANPHKPVRLEFEKLMLSAADIPAFEQLRSAVEACFERWKTKPKEREFFETALLMASANLIPVLRIADYETTGLTGSDTDEKGRWFALVKSLGVSNKDDTAGGSFGIGKSSPFAASRLRTVFYGTRTLANGVALQGVSRLVTHKNSQGRLTQGTGFIGDYAPSGGDDGEPLFSAVRNESAIPSVFRRAIPGTDIWIIGYRGGETWQADLVRSILGNFWPAIYRGSIEFKVAEQEINAGNVSDLITQHSGDEGFQAHLYFASLEHQPIEKKLNHTGLCQLYLTTASPDLPRRICMARGTGMRIFDYAPRVSRVPFSGLFLCTDADGNKLLRKLEPPRHDAWDPKRLEDSSGKLALDEIKHWIREELKRLNPLSDAKSFNELELAKYLPDAPTESTDGPEEAELGQTEEESLETKTPRSTPTPQRVPARPVPAAFEVGGDQGGNEPSGEEGKDEGRRQRGDKSSGGGHPRDDVPRLRLRSYQSDGENSYALLLRSDMHFAGTLSVFAVGEDGRREPVVLTGACLSDQPNTPLGVDGNRIHNLEVSPSMPLRLTIALDAPSRRSLIASALI